MATDTVVAPSASVAAGTSRALTTAGLALLANSGLSAVLGLGYWVVAARLYSTREVGIASAIISTMMVCSAVATLNYLRSLSNLIPRSGSGARRLVARVYLGTGLTAMVIAAAVAAGSTLVGKGTNLASYGLWAPVGFVIATALWTVFSLQDTVLTASRRSIVVPFENSAYGAAKLLLLVLFARGHHDAMAIFLSWWLPLPVVDAAINFYLFRSVLLRAASTVGERVRAVREKWLRLDLLGYFFWLLGTLPLPIVILSVFGPEQAARFYLPFTLVTTLDLVNGGLGNAVTAEITALGGELDRLVLKHMKRIIGGIAVLAALTCLAAPNIWPLLGHAYAGASLSLLMLMAVSAIPRCVIVMAGARERARRRGDRTLLLQAVPTVIFGLLLVAIRGHFGLIGVGVIWLCANTAGSVLASRSLVIRSRRAR